MTALPGRTTVLGFEEERKDGEPWRRLGRTITPSSISASPRQPFRFLVPMPTCSPLRATKVIENLQRHGIAVDELREDIELDVEIYRIDKVTETALYQNRQLVDVEATSRKETRRIAAGTILVRTDQPLGTLAAYLLEPQAEDGLCAWSFFEEAVREGERLSRAASAKENAADERTCAAVAGRSHLP